MIQRICKASWCGRPLESSQDGYCCDACRNNHQVVKEDVSEAKHQATEDYYRFGQVTVLVPVTMMVHVPTSVVLLGSVKIPDVDEVIRKYQGNQLKEVNAEIIHCPKCGGSNIITDMIEWKASPLESCDQGDEGILHEHQCQDCEGFSFWTGSSDE